MGFFDADGTINYYTYKNEIPQLYISVSQLNMYDIEELKNILGGSIYFNKSGNGHYK
jgi:hypothetical protein